MSADVVPVVEAPVPAVSVVERAGELLAAEWRPEHVWFAPSGLPVTGEETARHLEATLALLEKKGWRRDWGVEDGPQDPGPVNEDASTRDLFRYLIKLGIRALRYEYFDQPAGLTLSQAANQAGPDTGMVSGRCMSLILRASTGASTAVADRWVAREDRTFDEVRELLRTAAAFARQYGPEMVR